MKRFRWLRRACRLLAVAGLFALVEGLWPSPAQAKITCRVQDYRACSRYVCCLQTCLICTDSVTGYVDITCGDTYCWEQSY
jgi:hypothetical protein